MGLPGGDQIAAAIRANTAVAVMLFNVSANLVESAQELAIGPEKEIVSNHGISKAVPLAANQIRRDCTLRVSPMQLASLATGMPSDMRGGRPRNFPRGATKKVMTYTGPQLRG